MAVYNGAFVMGWAAVAEEDIAMELDYPWPFRWAGTPMMRLARVEGAVNGY
jgi:hypothetical protein